MSPDFVIVSKLRELTSMIAAAAVETRLKILANAVKYSPDQPRVPAGSPEGGQWTQTDPSDSISDATVEASRLGTELAQLGTQIQIGANGLTGISRIDEVTVALGKTLAAVVDTIGLVPRMDPLEYGRTVHFAFANAVRFGDFPGIGLLDVETTFGDEPDTHYGAKGSIRTDVILRNDVGDIIAIYDVKTGRSGLTRARVAELRAKTRAGPGVHFIEINLLRGVLLKHALARAVVIVHGWKFHW